MMINQHAIDNMKVGDKAIVAGVTGQICRIRHVKMAGRVFTIVCPQTADRKRGLVHQYEWDAQNNIWKSMKRRKK